MIFRKVRFDSHHTFLHKTQLLVILKNGYRLNETFKT